MVYYSDEITMVNFDNTIIDRAYGSKNKELVIIYIYVIVHFN